MTVDDLLPDHLFPGFCCLVLVNPARQLCTDIPQRGSLPFGLNPVIMINETVLTFSVGQSLCMPDS